MAKASTDTFSVTDGSGTAFSALQEGDLRLLYEIGVSAAAQGHGEAAMPIFDAIAMLEPGNAAAAIGYALHSIVRGEFDAAIGLLTRGATTTGKSADEAKALLLLALCMADRRDDARRLYLELMSGPDGAAQQLARKLFAGDGVTPAACGAPQSAGRNPSIADRALPDVASH